MSSIKFLLVLVGAVALALPQTAHADTPNVLIILADDCTYNDLPIYGGKNAKTPNLDRLASQGTVFNHAYLSSAMCQPCRAELYTGQFPLRNGCAWNHSASRPGTQSLPHYLAPLGYRVGLAGKVHVKPTAAFPFESIGGFDPNCVRNPTRAHEMEDLESFFNRDDQPFLAVVALVEPHVPWAMGDASQYPSERIQLPSNIADTERTREAYSRYLAEITYMDGQVGAILEALDKVGKSSDTLVFFSSEQGAQFPGCKWTNWDTGLHTALIAKWPGKTPEGRRVDSLVHYADMVPTLLEIADARPASGIVLDGVSFQDVLTGGPDKSERQFAYGTHNNLPEGPSYPIRTITDGTYRLIRNLASDRLYIEKHLMGLQGDGALNNPYWGTWVGEAWDNPQVYSLTERYIRRPEIALYHTAADPYELNNLAKDPEFAEVKTRLEHALDAWMATMGDPGVPMDTMEALRAARKGNHLYGPN